ncbi:MAG: hypothetical protein WDW36_005161 [Sanguina aurantia]
MSEAGNCTHLTVVQASLAATNMMEVEDAQFLPKESVAGEPAGTLPSANLPPASARASASQFPPGPSEPTRATGSQLQPTGAAGAGQTRATSLAPGFDGASSSSLPQESAPRQKPPAGAGQGTGAADDGGNPDQSRGGPGVRGTNGTAAHMPMAASVGSGWEETTFPNLAPAGEKPKLNFSKFKFKL